MMPQKRFSFLGLPLDPLTQNEVLEKIKLYLSLPRSFIHIVSINPENVIVAHQKRAFYEVCKKADLALPDGIGVVWGARLLGFSVPERVSGSVLLPKLLDLVGAMGLTGVLIGSQANLAFRLAQCYSASYPEATFIGTHGYKNIACPTPVEESAIEAIVRSRKPHFVFVAFGSPAQEIWIDTHRKLLEGCICMGVGGGFNYLSGVSSSPPKFMSHMGLEWLFRLVKEPWRIRRQASRLPLFVSMLLIEWIRGIIHPSHEKTPR